MSKVLEESAEIRDKFWGSFLTFTRIFFPIVTGRQFSISNPIGRESHFVSIARELTVVTDMKEPSLMINVPPGSGKSTMLAMWVAWTMSRYPLSQYLYISYSHELAAKHTAFIKRVIECQAYKRLFGVEIRQDSRAKDFFQTTAGGCVKAFGSSGSVVGQDAGLPNCDHFSGAVILDDMHKVDEAHSDTIRQSVITNYRETILQRPRAPNVPIVSIGQRVHEDDISAFMLSGKDERVWKTLILKSIDEAGNALYPEVNPLEQLLEKKDKNPYVFASQYQQNPIPAGGALFKEKDFILLDEDPKILMTFITADTAETSKSYNDATVFSFWGIYKLEEGGIETGQLGLHWIDCLEIRIEPKHLKSEFIGFYHECMTYPVKPLFAAIEKKSTGVTLVSVLEDMRGLQIKEVKRTRASGSKTERYLEMQPIIASKLVSLTKGMFHVEHCITHLLKITANGTHRHDDVCHTRGSKVATTRGNVNIEDITTNDKVITPFGIGSVIACGSTGFHPVIKRFGLESTPDHQVFDGLEFTPLMELTDMITLDKLSFLGLLRWKQRQLFGSMVMNLDLRHRQDISNVSKENIETNFFTVLYGNFIAERQYQKALLFTIRTITNLIIVTKIWSVFLISNIARSILKENPLAKSTRRNCSQDLEDIRIAKKVKKEVQKSQANVLSRMKSALVRFARKSLSELIMYPIYALQNASAPGLTNGAENGTLTDPSSSLNVYGAKQNLEQKTCHLKNTTQKPVPENAPETMDIKEVFSLTVETYGVYYCNGVLVRNCDTLYDACKLALIDKALYTDSIGVDVSNNIRELSKDFNYKLRARRGSLMGRGM